MFTSSCGKLSTTTRNTKAISSCTVRALLRTIKDQTFFFMYSLYSAAHKALRRRFLTKRKVPCASERENKRICSFLLFFLSYFFLCVKNMLMPLPLMTSSNHQRGRRRRTAVVRFDFRPTWALVALRCVCAGPVECRRWCWAIHHVAPCRSQGEYITLRTWREERGETNTTHGIHHDETTACQRDGHVHTHCSRSHTLARLGTL